MATGVNFWSSYELSHKVRESIWGRDQESSSEEGGGGVTWKIATMEVKGQLILAPDPLTCPSRKQRERMAELQERRRSLQALLSTRLAELRRICVQEAELTGAVPSDFPLEAGEKPPSVRRRGGAARHGNRKSRTEVDSQRSKPKKTLFSAALRKHSDSEHNTHTQTHTHHGKRTVHRGCHTGTTHTDTHTAGRLWVNGLPRSRGTGGPGVFRSSETLTEGQTSTNNRPSEGGAKGGGAGRGRGGAYSEVLLDYVWGKQQQLQRQPIVSQHQLLYNGYSSSQQPPGAPPPHYSHHNDQRRVKVTRTKSCGPFLPAQQSLSDTHNPPLSAIQPDPHPHLQPPRAPQLLPNQDTQLEEATRSLHKALALEGLRDWYLRNTIGSAHQNQSDGKGNTAASTKVNGGVKGQASGGGALQRRRTTHGVIQQTTYQTETGHHHMPPHHKQMLPHSATFHGRPLHGRSLDGSLYHDPFPPRKQEVPIKDLSGDQPSPGTLV
uniref:FERM domain-containing protein 4B-like n=1 Tax=Echeneis naucrates TaxID=173247 RepID=A0A665U1F8_ECHNA